MHWKTLLTTPTQITHPWLGTRTLHAPDRAYFLTELPPEHGWHRFEVGGSRRATWLEATDPDPGFERDHDIVTGYLVEDRLIADGAAVPIDVASVFRSGERVHLIEPGLDRFARARAARTDGGRLIYLGPDFPLGPELDVVEAWQDRAATLDGIRGVTPALHLAFLWHHHRRARAEARRAEAERVAREAAEQQARLAAFDAALRGRHALLRRDFDAAARAALAMGGAELLDAREGYLPHERVVQFRFRRQRFECVVDRHTLRVIDAGVCLIDHATEERGDARFTLESLVAVIDEAIRTHQLVVFRHVG